MLESTKIKEQIQREIDGFTKKFPRLNFSGNTPIDPSGAGLTYGEEAAHFLYLIGKLNEWANQLDMELKEFIITYREELEELVKTFNDEIYDTMNDILDKLIKSGEFDESISRLLVSFNQKADISYVDEMIASIASGGPKDLFYSLNALKNMYPNGKEGTYLVFDAIHEDGAHIYIWKNNTWVDVGVYQQMELEDLSVTLSKIFLEGYLPLMLQYKHGRETGDNKQWVNANVSILKKGTIVKSNKSDLDFMIYTNKNNTWMGVTPTWTQNFVFKDDVSLLKIVVRFNPLREIKPLEISRISSWIEIVTEDTALKRKEMQPVYDALSEYNPIKLELGAIDGNGVSQGVGNARLRSVEFVSVKNGETLINKDKINLEIAVAKKDGVSWVTNPAWTDKDVSFDFSGDVRYMIRKKNNEVFTGDDIKKYSDIVGLRTLDKLAKLSDVQSESSFRDSVKYVRIDGDDSNNGNSYSNAYATLQKALDARPSTIYVERGTYYHQTATSNNVDDLRIIGYGNSIAKVVFKGADLLSNWEEIDGIYRTAYANNQRFTDVFVNHTLPIETTDSRPTFNAVLWESNDEIVSDYKMTPVLSLAECQNEQGTFYYDGEFVYINPNNIDNRFHAVKTNNGLNVRGKKVLMQDIYFDFYSNDPVNFDNIDDLTLIGCGASHSSGFDGFSCDNTNGVAKTSSAYKNRNDGFNMHAKGNMDFENCEASYNYDDGISHHENCTGVVRGGKFVGNGKGGISPAYGAKVNVYNALIKDNGFGIYNVHGENDDVENISTGNIFVGNGTAIANINAKIISANDTFKDNTNLETGNTPVTYY